MDICFPLFFFVRFISGISVPESLFLLQLAISTRLRLLHPVFRKTNESFFPNVLQESAMRIFEKPFDLRCEDLVFVNEELYGLCLRKIGNV